MDDFEFCRNFSLISLKAPISVLHESTPCPFGLCLEDFKNHKRNVI